MICNLENLSSLTKKVAKIRSFSGKRCPYKIRAEEKASYIRSLNRHIKFMKQQIWEFRQRWDPYPIKVPTKRANNLNGTDNLIAKI